MMEKAINFLHDYALTAGVRLIGALLIIIVGFWLVKILTKLLKRGKFWSRVDDSARTFILSFISIALRVVLLLTAAAVLGVPMTNMVALLGSIGLAIGLALQGSLSNFAGGLMILIFRPFNVGDYIDSSSGAGTVQAISILYTTLVTPDGKRVVIPNGALSNSAVTNFSVEENRRVDVECSVSRDSDIDAVRGILLGIAEKHELVIDTPEPFARLLKTADSSLVFILRAWCKAADYWTVLFDLNEQVKREFDRSGVRVPYPRMDVHVDK